MPQNPNEDLKPVALTKDQLLYGLAEASLQLYGQDKITLMEIMMAGPNEYCRVALANNLLGFSRTDFLRVFLFILRNLHRVGVRDVTDEENKKEAEARIAQYGTLHVPTQAELEQGKAERLGHWEALTPALQAALLDALRLAFETWPAGSLRVVELAIAKEPLSWFLTYHFSMGTQVKDAMRIQRGWDGVLVFLEADLPTGNLDDYYIEALERTVVRARAMAAEPPTDSKH